MNIIFGDAVKNIPNNYTVLELDTFRILPGGRLVTSYCLIENIPLSEFPFLETNKKTHQALMEEYRKRNWTFCSQAIAALTGAWNREADSFYKELQTRIDDFAKNPPPADWDGAVVKA